MSLGHSKPIVGLDMGRSSVKAVAVRAGRIVRRGVLDCRAEGMIDDPEAVLEALPGWVRGLGLNGAEITVCIPQYLGTIQVNDFPPGVRTDKLDQMVAYETEQAAEFSDDGFLHDHAAMPPGLGKANPVVIGIAKSTVIEERAQELAPAGLNLYDFTLSGIALANAYFALHPEKSRSPSPQMLLDIGLESSTLVIVAGGQILSVSSLLFGGQRYTLDLAKHLGVSEVEAETSKAEADLDAGGEDGPLQRASRQLDSEIREAVEHWRSQETGEAGTRMFEFIGLCGGGAKLGGLVQHLGREYGCEARIVGPADESGAPDPQTTIAYGGALQGVGRAALPISLRTPSIACLAARRANAGTFTLAVLLLTVALAVGGAWLYRNLRVEERAVTERIDELKRCERVIPQLNELIRTREHRERVVLPIVAKANRAHRFLRAVDALAEVRGDDDWFVYLGDQESYHRVPGEEQSDDEGRIERDQLSNNKRKTGRDDRRLMGFLTGAGGDKDAPAANQEFPRINPVTDVQPMRALVAAGFSKYLITEPYKHVREMVDRLNGASKDEKNTKYADLFDEVDLLPNQEIEPDKQLFGNWLEHIDQNEAAREKYKPFLLKLPFASQPVTLPESERSGKKPKS